MGLFSRKSKNAPGKQSSNKNVINNVIQSNLDRDVFIKQIHLRNHQDYMLLEHELKNGNIMIANLEQLVRIANGPTKDYRPLRNHINLIKKYCVQNGGSFSNINDEKIIITPNSQFEF